jgi:hypothetical protein
MNRTVGGPSLDARNAPTIAWEKLDHFLDHVERGRRRRKHRSTRHLTTQIDEDVMAKKEHRGCPAT